ncbi:MAG: PAS domain-containing protein [Gammaproteobacteria bacterium]|nr:PAS domain-containing protein [Gammaproteobacteria bacterium]
MREEDFIVSKTDTKGRITYANRIFMEFAGYAEDELLGVQHNIVRHPDMPRAVFEIMWQELSAGHEFFGYLKNLASDGSYYWTFAHVAPTHDSQGHTTGYYSVRRKPGSAGVALFAALYEKMLATEREAGPKDAIAASRPLFEDAYESRGTSYEEFVLAV